MANKKELQKIIGFIKYSGCKSIKEMKEKGIISENEINKITKGNKRIANTLDLTIKKGILKKLRINKEKYYLIPKKNLENRFILDFRECQK